MNILIPGAFGFGLLFSFDTLLALAGFGSGYPGLSTVPISECASMLCFAIAVFFAEPLDRVIGRSRVLLAGVTTGTIGAAVAFTLLVSGIPQMPLAVLSEMLIAVFTVCCFLRYYRSFSLRPLTEVVLTLALGHILSGALLFAVTILSVNMLPAILALFVPAAVALLLRRYERECRKSADVSDMEQAETSAVVANGIGSAVSGSDSGKLVMLVRPLALLAVTIFMRGTFSSSILNDGIALDFAGVIASALFVLLVIRSGGSVIRFKLLYDIAMFSLMAGLFLFALSAAFVSGSETVSDLSGFFTNAGYVTFDIFFIAILCNSCQRYALSTVRVFGLVGLVESLVFGLATFAGTMVSNQPCEVRMIAAFAGALTLAACYVMLLTDHDYRTAWGTSADSEGRPSIADFYYTIPEVCSALSQQYGLTRREEEVLILLAQRKTVPDVETELFISNSTAKSHCKSIYRKLGIHKREELLRLVGHPSVDERLESELRQ